MKRKQVPFTVSLILGMSTLAAVALEVIITPTANTPWLQVYFWGSIGMLLFILGFIYPLAKMIYED